MLILDMATFSPSDIIALGSLSLALTTTGIGALLWYVQGEKKKYASERDFQHLRRNQEAISQGIKVIADEAERKLDLIGRDILEIRIMLGIKNNTNNDDSN